MSIPMVLRSKQRNKNLLGRNWLTALTIVTPNSSGNGEAMMMPAEIQRRAFLILLDGMEFRNTTRMRRAIREAFNRQISSLNTDERMREKMPMSVKAAPNPPTIAPKAGSTEGASSTINAVPKAAVNPKL